MYLDGKEISAISPNVLQEGLKNYWSFPEFYTFMTLHGFPQITEIPISKIIKLFHLEGIKVQQLICAFRVNEILGGPHICEDVTIDTIIADQISQLTLTKLMEVRIDELTESAGNLMSDLFDIEETNREELEKLLNNEISNDSNLVIMRVIQGRINEILLLEKRMIKYIPSYDCIDLESFISNAIISDNADGLDPILAKFKDTEYLPSITFESMMQGITLHKDKKQYKILYLKRLILRYLTKPRKVAVEVDDF